MKLTGDVIYYFASPVSGEIEDGGGFRAVTADQMADGLSEVLGRRITTDDLKVRTEDGVSYVVFEQFYRGKQIFSAIARRDD